MKQLIILSVIISAAACFSQTPEDRFVEANRAYESHRYRDARILYEKLLGEGVAAKALYFNYANACFKTQALGSAVLYYEKALRIDPEDDDIRANLQMVQGRLKDKMAVPPDFVLFQWSKSVIFYGSINSLIIGLLTCLYMISIFMIVSWLIRWNSPLQNRIRHAGIVFLIGWALVTGYRIGIDHLSHEAVVMTSSVNVQNEPLPEGSVACVIHEGTKVHIKSRRDEWVEIRLPDGVTGWIPDQSIEQI